ncbi:single-stranded DNA-binding protein [Candidatus Margulisiibacteriota bacterium]
MRGFNNATLVGTLTKDPEAKNINDVKKTTFTLAVERPYKNKEGEKETDFINISAWRKLADICDEYLVKGKRVLISGRIQTHTYEQDKVTKWFTEVIADDMTMLSFPQKKKEKEAA